MAHEGGYPLFFAQEASPVPVAIRRRPKSRKGWGYPLMYPKRGEGVFVPVTPLDRSRGVLIKERGYPPSCFGAGGGGILSTERLL
jgi:hypothetical protein